MRNVHPATFFIFKNQNSAFNHNVSFPVQYLPRPSVKLANHPPPLTDVRDAGFPAEGVPLGQALPVSGAFVPCFPGGCGACC